MTFPNVNIIRGRGTPNKVTLVDGSVAYRKPKIFVPEYQWEVPCIDYDNHFVFEVPKKLLGSAYMCSCGSPAVVIGRQQYKHGSSMEGARFACLQHINYGLHLDGST